MRERVAEPAAPAPAPDLESAAELEDPLLDLPNSLQQMLVETADSLTAPSRLAELVSLTPA